MIKGRVIGEVWATRKALAIEGYRLKLVAVADADAPATVSGRVVVAVDPLDASRGQLVMVTFGSGARNVMRPGARDNRDLLCDCAVSQIIDGETS